MLETEGKRAPEFYASILVEKERLERHSFYSRNSTSVQKRKEKEKKEGEKERKMNEGKKEKEG